jgi:LPS sulfotransferase NodH
VQNQRQAVHRKNIKLERLLTEINGLLGPVEEQIISNFHQPDYPTVLIVGCARSGSTLLFQWLAQTGIFAYPTNLISRFYAAPYIGARIQQLLTDPDYRFRDEFFDLSPTESFESDLGKTKGILAPNEFWYFWRRFFPYNEIQYLEKHDLERIDIDRFSAEFAAIQDAFDKPLLMKGMIINWNIPYVSQNIGRIIFLHIKREPIFNSQSLLEARDKFFGDTAKWYSFKPREYNDLIRLDPFNQVAGQVLFTNRAIEAGLSQVPGSKQLTILYEELCAKPEKIYKQIIDLLETNNFSCRDSYTGPLEFNSTNDIRLPKHAIDSINKAYNDLSMEKR